MKMIFRLLFVLMAVTMLFGITDARSQECTLVQISGGSTSPTPYTLTFTGQTPCTPQSPCIDKENISHTTGSLWNYKAGGSIGSITQLLILAPVCNPDLGVFVQGGGQVMTAGIGDSTTGYGAGDFQDEVARLALNSSSTYSLGVSSDVGIRDTSVQIRVSKNLYYCPSIPGPDCPGPADIPVLRQKNLLIDGMYVKLNIDQSNCVQGGFMCDNNFQNCIPIEPVTLTATSSDGRISNTIVRDIGDVDGNQLCLWGRIVIGEHTCNSYPTGIPGKYILAGNTCPCTLDTQCYTGYKCVNRVCTKSP